MAKLHIVSVGGTGHKALASLIHLAACGAFRNKQLGEISIIAIDADNANGNLVRAKKTFENYKRFYQTVNGNDSDLIKINSVVPDLNISLFQGDKRKLSIAFNFANLHASSEEELIQFLYTGKERDTEFEEGFYGHTSVGAVIVRDVLMEETKDENGKKEEKEKNGKNSARKAWNEFKKQITHEDKIVVVGSIFGGTGASCIPVLLKELEDKMKGGAGLAAVILTPYFQAVRKPDKEGAEEVDSNKLQPDSNNFNIKAKAALNYYEIEKKLGATDALYVIGEPNVNYSFEIACRGNAAQKNKAHPIELFAATAILDFVLNNANRQGGKLCVAKRDFINGEYCYTWEMLRCVDSDLPLLMQTFTRAAIFYNKTLYPQLENDSKTAGIWKKYYNDGQGLLEKSGPDNQPCYKDIGGYLELFSEWIFELHKRNLNEMDPAAKEPALKWIPDGRVKLLNVHLDDERFSSEWCSDGRINNFEKLIYPEEKEGRTSEEILAELSCRKPNGNGFPALFVTLKELLKKEARNPFRRQKPVPALKAEPKNYLADHNNVAFHVSPEHNSLWTLCPTEDNLGEIARGLPDTDRAVYTLNDVSIPSPWSIFITNEMSLTRDQFKGLNEYAYNQWCGIIALLFLRRFNNYEAGHRLEVRRLPAWKDENGRFLQIIKDLNPPQSRIFGKQNPNWLDHAAVKLGDETIAFLAHNTLVCPAFSMSRSAVTLLHKFAPTIVGSDGEFLSPKEYFKDQNDSNNKRSKYALQLALNQLKSEIADNSVHGVNHEIAKSMMDLLDKYLEDLGTVQNLERTMTDGISLPFPLSINSVHDVFDKLCIDGQKVDEDNLPFLLQDTLQEKKVAIVSLDFTGMNDAELRTSYVTPDLVYSQIRTDNIRDLVAGSKGEKIELVYDEDLLCDSMVMRGKEQAGEENVFCSLSAPTGASLPDYEVVWPVSEKLLELYTPEQLNKMLRIEKKNADVFVTLTLAVAGKMGAHSVAKKYAIKQIGDARRGIDDVGICSVFEPRRLPFWALWPYAKIVNNQNESVWQRYTFFCVDHVYNDTPVFAIEPFFAGGASKDLKPKKLSAINVNSRDFYYRHCAELPTALKIFEQKNGNPVYRGMVFLNSPEPKTLQTFTWNVGVDFGTTSTSVFYNTGNVNESRFLQLLNEYRWQEGNNTRPEEPVGDKLETSLKILCDSGDQDQSYLNYYFIDKHCLAQKGYTTTFEELENTVNDEAATLFDSGRIFWHNYENFRNVNAVEGRREHLKNGIKWENDKKWAARYLNQLLTQIAYRAIEKGAGEIHWFFSYPTAFSSLDQTLFADRLKSLVGGLRRDTGLKDDDRETGLKHKFESEGSLLTESVAAALFFKIKNPDYSTFLCVDIGGGTSDISIWVNRDLKFQTSAKFASRDMFITPLAALLERQSVLDMVCTSEVSDGIHTMLRFAHKNVGKESIPFLIETVLFEYIINFKNRLNELRGEDKQAFHHFIYLVYVAYAGLFFYLANLIAALLNNDLGEDRIDRDITDIVFGLSGKGSKLTEWIPTYCKSIYRTAEALIREKTGCEIKFKQIFEENVAKTETAYGLICDLNENGRQNTQWDRIQPKIFMGCDCNVQITGEQEVRRFRKDDLVPSHDAFFKRPEKLTVKFDDLSLADFDEFIEFLDRVAEETGNEVEAAPREWYNDKEKKSLLSKMTNYFNNQILEKERRFDPPFIVMLKEFLKEYGKYVYGKE
jgi:hypothetical protein